MTETPVNKGLLGFRSFTAAPAAYTLPKLAPYRLGYTRKYVICCYYTTLAVVVKHVVISRFFREPPGRGDPRDPSKIRAPQVLRFRRHARCVHAPKGPALPTGLHPVMKKKKTPAYAGLRLVSIPAGEPGGYGMLHKPTCSRVLAVSDITAG